jgi:hypothetical protein
MPTVPAANIFFIDAIPDYGVVNWNAAYYNLILWCIHSFKHTLASLVPALFDAPLQRTTAIFNRSILDSAPKVAHRRAIADMLARRMIYNVCTIFFLLQRDCTHLVRMALRACTRLDAAGALRRHAEEREGCLRPVATG